MGLLCDKCGRKAIPPSKIEGAGELMRRRHLFMWTLNYKNSKIHEKRNKVLCYNHSILVRILARKENHLTL